MSTSAYYHQPMFRVSDGSSPAYQDRKGNLWAAAQCQPVSFRPENMAFKESLEEHLDWNSRAPSPFLSVFAGPDARKRADMEAKRRLASRFQCDDVVVYEISIKAAPKAEFRRLSQLLEATGITAPDRARHMMLGDARCDAFEVVFLNCIPEEYIVEVTEYEESSDSDSDSDGQLYESL